MSSIARIIHAIQSLVLLLWSCSIISAAKDYSDVGIFQIPIPVIRHTSDVSELRHIVSQCIAISCKSRSITTFLRPKTGRLGRTDVISMSNVS